MKEWLAPALGTVAVWGLWSFLPKIATQYVTPRSATVFQALGGLVFVAIVLLTSSEKIEIHPIGTALAIVTGILGVAGAYLFLLAVSSGPVTLVTALSSLYPLATIVLAVALLGETLTARQVVGMVLALIAVVLVSV
ncbi:MAG: EamA family transporter [Cyanobacteria bacterium J06642_2]